MRIPRGVFPALLAPLVLAACESPVAPTVETTAPVLAAMNHGCAAAPDWLATDEPTLAAAVAGAASDDVIAIDGMIHLTSTLEIFVPGVTLTCATPGSGVFTTPADALFDLIGIRADDVIVERLVLDGTNTLDGALFAIAAAPPAALTGVRLGANDVTCGQGYCVFFVGTQDSEISDNRFTAVHPIPTGIQVQLGGAGGPSPIPTDGMRVERNVVLATVAIDPPFSHTGGIRVRDGAEIVIQHNHVLGPWINSMALSEMESSVVAGNTLHGAQQAGWVAATNNFNPVSFHDNVVRDNRVSGAGVVGLDVRRACGNTFTGNNLSGNGGNAGGLFRPTTGANLLVGNGGIVFDDGDYDCDGDAVSDPNTITGHGPVRTGGPAVGEAMSGSSELL